MKALSIRQPWAWMILHAGKDIENRTWATTYRGRILIHASLGMTKLEYSNAIYQAMSITGAIDFPRLKDLPRGGIVGSVEIVDCVRPRMGPSGQLISPWYTGLHGFVLRNPQVLPFRPLRGELGLFDVPKEFEVSA